MTYQTSSPVLAPGERVTYFPLPEGIGNTEAELETFQNKLSKAVAPTARISRCRVDQGKLAVTFTTGCLIDVATKRIESGVRAVVSGTPMKQTPTLTEVALRDWTPYGGAASPFAAHSHGSTPEGNQ